MAMYSAQPGSIEDWTDLYLRTNDRLGDAERRLARAELMHKRTAEHLREERMRRRDVEHRLKEAEDGLLCFSGSEDLESVRRTPAHYKGDGYVTCRRAMESANAQGHIAEPSRMSFYWWACACRYVWRMWSKADPAVDGNKAIDCIRKALKGYVKRPQKVASYDWGKDG